MFESGREHGDVTRQGDGLSTLAKLLWHTGRTVEADARAREAVALLEQLPPGPAVGVPDTVAGGHTRAHRGLQALFVPRSFT